VSIDQNQLPQLLDFAVDIARGAGQITLDYFKQAPETTTKTDGSFVTIADRESETYLRRRILEKFPGDGILGEEEGERAGSSGRRWIIDPLDGTFSFVHGVPFYGVLVALEIQNQIEVGVINAPAVDEIVYAASGVGCFWNGNPTCVSNTKRLEDALLLGDPITDLTIAMEVNYFQLNRAEYYVPVVMKIPGSELALARRGGAERTVIDFIGEIKDEYGTTIQNIRDKVDIKFSGETAAQLATRPIEYDTGYTLLPGTYSIKVLARDAETGRIGTFLSKFVIPNLNKEEKRIPISSVVLSAQRVDLRDAVYTAGKDKDQVTNPLVQDGQKLIPSVTRVFSKSRDMYVYLQAYQPAAVENAPPLVSFVTFYRGKSKAFETPPLAVNERLNNKLKTP